MGMQDAYLRADLGRLSLDLAGVIQLIDPIIANPLKLKTRLPRNSAQVFCALGFIARV